MNHSPNFLLADFGEVRRHTLSLAEPLSDEDCCVQSMPDASPIKWHMAHTTWFFETFILERFEPRFQPHHPAFRVLFNSYYNGVGQKHPRAQRGLVTRPSVQEVLAYRRNVDERIVRLLSKGEPSGELAAMIELGLQHEQQHQELMLTDVKHLLSMNPLYPAYRAVGLESSSAAATPLSWQDFEAGVTEIGHAGTGFCFDNETPRHRVFTESFSLASRLVSNGEYLGFIEAGGYTDPSLWLSEGWDWVRNNQLTQPFYWRNTAGWQEFTLYGLQPLDSARPAVHLSYFEADAYARWAGARLPTEAEWERAAAAAGEGIASTNPQRLHPVAASTEDRLSQLYGAAWQWTSSSYAPYPGYSPVEGAIGEYNGKFMANQYVLRGSSCATPARHTRATYRNFFPTSACWQFTGIRLARS
ncbi:ergothioneine biosynthesis protein EgtB [Noviherbaspirillum sp.]|uniref:ergothioneine biosynthesis protein EgtB n=1 Tax=Noviherbaspirillum sp. TaxID=1926288 RepID=UPI002FE420D2